MIEENKDCPCKRIKCERHGDCIACNEHHHTSKKKPFTACDRIKQKEDRKQSRKR